MSEENLQEASVGGSRSTEIGGFMAGTHKLHISTYGPNSPLPSKAKVFLMIQHHLIANWQIRMAIPKSLIARETGVDVKQVQKIVHKLAKENFLLIENRTLNKVAQSNIYRLHPKVFGDNPLYQGESVKKPTFQVINGGTFVDQKKKGGVISATRDGENNHPRGGVQYDPTKTEDLGHHSANPDRTRTLQEHIKKTTQKKVESNALNLKKLIELLLVDFPNDIHRIKSAYNYIKESKQWNGKEVKFPEGFILGGWKFIRSDFEFVDDLIRQKSETQLPKLEEPMGEHAPEKVRHIIDSVFKKMK